MKHEAADVFLSLLPARYRSRYQMDPAAGTFHSGILQLLLALAVYGALFFRYLNSYGALSGSVMAGPEAAGRNLYSTSFGMGVIGWLSFTISPGPLAAMYFMIEGVVRMIAGSMMNEPVASLPFWLAGQAHAGVDRVRARLRRAPPALDQVELGQPGCGWDLRVTCVEKKPEWTSMVQVDYNGTLYHISAAGEEVVEGLMRFRYCLRKSSEVGAYRGIVRYDPFQFYR